MQLRFYAHCHHLNDLSTFNNYISYGEQQAREINYSEQHKLR